MNKFYTTTADATGTYVERAPANIARSECAAAQGNMASFSRDNTLMFSNVSLIPMHKPKLRGQVLVQHLEVLEEEAQLTFLPR